MKRKMLSIFMVVLVALLFLVPGPALAMQAQESTPARTQAAPAGVGTIDQFKELVDGPKLATILGLVGVNVALGIAVGIKTKTFRLKESADFLRSRVLPYLVAYYAIGFAAVIDPQYNILISMAFGLITAALAGAIATNLKELGLPMPDFLGGGLKIPT